MSPTVLLIFAGGLLAIVDIVRSDGRALTSWGVLLLAIALEWGRLG